MMAEPFTWGMGGQKITTPEQAKRQREIAAALTKRAPSENWAQGLGSVTAALAANAINERSATAEATGRQSVADALAGLGPQSSFSDISGAISNPWVTDSPGASSIVSALLGRNLDASDPMNQLRLQQAQLDYDQDLAGVPSDANTYGLTPIWGQLPDGSFAYGVQGKDGSFQQVDTGELAPLDPRTLAGERAAGTATGKAGVEMALAAPGDVAQADMALDLINQIETSKEKPWATGTSAGLGGNSVPGTGRYGFQNLVEQAKSGAFLTAIDDMRGLGALSNTEGQAATQAITRINTALSEPDFDKALADYKKIVERGRDRAMRRVRVDDRGNETPIDGPVASTPPTPASSGQPADWTEYFKDLQ